MARHLLATLFFAIYAVGSSAYEISFSQDGDDKSVFHYVPVAHGRWAISALGKDFSRREGREGAAVKIDKFNKLGAAEMLFYDNGGLKLFSRLGDDEVAREADFKLLSKKIPEGPEKIASLWRKRDESNRKRQRWWKRDTRLTLWYFNPNGAGLFLAEVVVLLVAISIFFSIRRVWTIVLLALAGVSAMLMLATGSRGGLVALALSLGFMLLYWACVKWRIKGFVLSFAALIVLALSVRAGLLGSRYGRDIFERSEGNLQRLQAWRAAPTMMAAAPDGWSEYCGRDYGDWFQDEHDRHPLLYLVNTHLTWMVSGGRVFSYLYCIVWMLLVLVLALWEDRRLKPVVLSMWILFFTANFFSTLGIFASLWVMPIALIAVAIPGLMRLFTRHPIRMFLMAMLSIVVGIVPTEVMMAIGKRNLAKMEVPVRREGSITFVGSGEPVVYMVPDYWALSHFIHGSVGRDVREWCEKHPHQGTLALADSIGDLPEKVDRLVLNGIAADDYRRKARSRDSRKSLCKADNIIMLSPMLPLNALNVSALEKKGIDVYAGEFLAEFSGKVSTPRIHIVPGCELYITNWVDIAFSRRSR